MKREEKIFNLWYGTERREEDAEMMDVYATRSHECQEASKPKRKNRKKSACDRWESVREAWGVAEGILPDVAVDDIIMLDPDDFNALEA